MIKITFGMIVLNGQPFIKYNLRGLYPFAHQIIVVEGASPAASSFSTESGHSTDGTLEALYEFKKEEDPEDKVTIVTAEDEGYSDGFWPGEKDEQSRTYAKRATGNYLWQVDADEFYHSDDIAKMILILESRPEITAVTFPMITFWGSPYVITDGWYLRRGASSYHRLFRWGEGYEYHTHRPPTVLDSQKKDTRSAVWVKSSELKKKGIFLYHYSLLFPRHVYEKCEYYENAEWAQRLGSLKWYENDFVQLQDPFHVHNVFRYLAWLEKSKYPIPAQIKAMWKNIRANPEPSEPIRKMDDVELLLKQPMYNLRILFYKIADYPDRLIGFLKSLLIKWFRK